MANYTREFLTAKHSDYEDNLKHWNFHYRSYLGGDDFANGYFLNRYILEQDDEYIKRIDFTPLDNHCRNVVQIYSSFLFRVPPSRDYGSMTGDPQLESFLQDADLDGRSFHNVIKDMQQHASVYGSCWALIDKPATITKTRAEELQQDIRPYISIYTPENVTNWRYERLANGRFYLTSLTIVEDINPEQADKQLQKWVNNIEKFQHKYLKQFLRTFHKWKPYILSFFKERWSNGIVEGINNRIKMIKRRANDWITKLRMSNQDGIILVSAMADTTKVPPVGEFCQRHKVWVGNIFPDHCIKEKDFSQHVFVQTTMASEIKVGMLSVQNCTDGISPFKMIAACQQSTNEVADDYNSSLLHAVDDIDDVHCVSMTFDGLAAETNFI